ncbi:MAG: 2-oxoacid:acceptor oxidoreductase family protein [Desulfobulbaceae bacterium]|jgi:indolepyruvate ferredoxin oxidoreductase beta subunit|nr:2-oxoacid:acceptor oxidoreductase family protein [Desulfobulbaceae bacterium]
MQSYNIYLCGVGGQGIGLLSEILLRAADYSGYAAKAVDTHGLAQRGGTVISQIRLGKVVFTPMIPARSADLVVALERHEALRGLQVALRDQGTLIYYNTVFQPLGVRLGNDIEVSAADIEAAGRQRGITVYQVARPDIPDPRMQNIAVLAEIHRRGLVPGLQAAHFLQAMEDLLAGTVLEANLRLFHAP